MTTQENVLARHKILHELGRGATGAVYAARDRTTGATVALKRIDPPLVNEAGAGFGERLLKHARSARLLNHPNIARIHAAGVAAGTAYVAMELLEGETLRKILDDGPLPIARAIQIVHEIACGLAYAHLEGVVHGDLKPSNIVVLRSGAVKITDFGIGRLGHAALLSGKRAGCASYLSPEQVRGEAIDHRCDLFSLGALFYEMLARRRPFEGGSPKEITENILHAEPPPPSQRNPHVPRALDALVSSMLAKQPSLRMAGVPILLRELQRFEEGIGLRSEASAGSREPTPSAPPEPKREPRTPDANRIPDDAPIPDPITDREAFDYRLALMDRESRSRPSPRPRTTTLAALALALVVLGTGLAGFTGLSDFTRLTGFIDDFAGRSSEPHIVASRMQEVPAKPDLTPAPPVAEATKEAVTALDGPQASPPREIPDAKAEQDPPGVLATADSMPPTPVAVEQTAPAGAAPAEELSRKTETSEELPAQPPSGTARLILAVSPRGEIYIDGKHHGTTPPITTLDLEPGMRRVEVRSGSRKPYLTYMTVEPGDVRRIRHDFNAKPIRPPR